MPLYSSVTNVSSFTRRNGTFGAGGGVPLTDQVLALAPFAMYDATRSDSCYVERTGASATTPSVQNGPVGTLKDLSGNARHLIAPSDAGRPQRNTTGWIETDARDDYLGVTVAISQPIVRIASWRPIGGAGVNSQIFGGVTGNAGALYVDTATSVKLFSGSTSVASQPIVLQTDQTTVERHNGASSRLSKDGVSYTSGNAGTTLPGGIRVGNSSAGNAGSGIRLYRMVEFNRDPSDDEIATAVAWCQEAYPTDITILSNRSNVTTNRQAYPDRVFGVMVCWNLATFMNTQIGTGTESANTFNPTALDMDQWLDAIVASGASYVVPVCKHHDGFCWWPSTAQPYNVSASAWYAANGSPDLLSLFYTKAVARGLTVIPYVSIWDKNWEITNPIQNGYLSEVRFRNFTNAILTEIKARCPDAAGIWTDGWYWHFSNSYNQLHPSGIWPTLYSLWPDGLLIENNHLGNTTYTDIKTHEEGIDTIPSDNTIPSEVINTVFANSGGPKWFWQAANTLNKTAAGVVASIADSQTKNASYLLSVGPDNTGVLPADQVTLLADIGALLP